MNILEALSQQAPAPKKCDSSVIMPDGMQSVSLGVFEATIHRLGLNPIDYDDVMPEEREELLRYYETNINKKM